MNINSFRSPRRSLNALAVAALFAGASHWAAAQTIALGSASSYAILAGSAITFSAPGVQLSGNIGSDPTSTVNGIGNVPFLTGTNLTGSAGAVASRRGRRASRVMPYRRMTTTGV